MKTKLLALALLCGASLARGQSPPASNPITMVFSETEVSQVLKAVSLRTGASIVFAAGKDKVPVTINVTVNTPEDAIRSVVSAAGLMYRKVGNLFIVAPPSGMRQALEPYSYRVTFAITSGGSTEIATKLQEAFPYATITPAAGNVAMVGLLVDINSADLVVKALEAQEIANQSSTEVVVLRRAQASSLVTLLQGLYPDLKISATAKPDPADPKDAPNVIGLSGPMLELKLAKGTIEQLDFGSERVDNPIVLKIYNLRYVSASAVSNFLKQSSPEVQVFTGPEAIIPHRATFNPLTASLSSGGSGTGYFGGSSATSGSSPTGTSDSNAVKPGDRATVVVLKGRSNDVDQALHLIGELDKKPRLIVVEVNVIETSPEDDEQIGLTYNWAPFDFIQAPAGTVLTTNPAGQGFTQGGATTPISTGLLSMVPWNFRAILSAMVTHKTAKILARPSVQVVDNGEASVFIGNTIRAAVATQGALGAQNVTVEEFPVGIILLISPRVNADGNITMHVNPVVSAVTSVDANNIPQTSAREAETTTIVKSGETVVLGGLIQDEDIRTAQEIPFLSKLPIVGELFRYHSRTHTRSDIIISITPHLLKDDDKGAN
jgi:general secretion pathway protein D